MNIQVREDNHGKKPRDPDAWKVVDYRDGRWLVLPGGARVLTSCTHSRKHACSACHARMVFALDDVKLMLKRGAPLLALKLINDIHVIQVEQNIEYRAKRGKRGPRSFNSR